MMAPPRYSVIVPVYNERDNLEELHRRLKKVMDSIGDYEIIYVDDGSSDGSGDILDSFKSPDVRVVHLGRNMGQSYALFHGMSIARGDVIITIDADLQNYPEDIPELLKKMEDDKLDCVSGWRRERMDPFLSKKLPSYVSNFLARNLINVDIHDFGCTLKAYRRSALKDMEYWDGAHRYIPAMLALRGHRVGEVEVRHKARERGRSKYGLSRLIIGFLDLLYLRFFYKPPANPKLLYGAIALMPVVMAFLLVVFSSYTGDEYLRAGVAIVILPMVLLSILLLALYLLLHLRYRSIIRLNSGILRRTSQ